MQSSEVVLSLTLIYLWC